MFNRLEVIMLTDRQSDKQTLLKTPTSLRYVTPLGKNVLNSSIFSTCPHNMVNFGALTDRLASLGHPSKFQQVSRLGFITAPM